mgnify:CR=1 FL=1
MRSVQVTIIAVAYSAVCVVAVISMAAPEEDMLDRVVVGTTGTCCILEHRPGCENSRYSTDCYTLPPMQGEEQPPPAQCTLQDWIPLCCDGAYAYPIATAMTCYVRRADRRINACKPSGEFTTDSCPPGSARCIQLENKYNESPIRTVEIWVSAGTDCPHSQPVNVCD